MSDPFIERMLARAQARKSTVAKITGNSDYDKENKPSESVLANDSSQACREIQFTALSQEVTKNIDSSLLENKESTSVNNLNILQNFEPRTTEHSSNSNFLSGQKRSGPLARRCQLMNEWDDDYTYHSNAVGNNTHMEGKAFCASKKLDACVGILKPYYFGESSKTEVHFEASLDKNGFNYLPSNNSATNILSPVRACHNVDSFASHTFDSLSAQSPTRQLQWDKSLLQSLEAQGFSPTQSMSHLIYEYTKGDFHDNLHRTNDKAVEVENKSQLTTSVELPKVITCHPKNSLSPSPSKDILRNPVNLVENRNLSPSRVSSLCTKWEEHIRDASPERNVKIKSTKQLESIPRCQSPGKVQEKFCDSQNTLERAPKAISPSKIDPFQFIRPGPQDCITKQMNSDAHAPRSPRKGSDATNASSKSLSTTRSLADFMVKDGSPKKKLYRESPSKTFNSSSPSLSHSCSKSTSVKEKIATFNNVIAEKRDPAELSIKDKRIIFEKGLLSPSKKVKSPLKKPIKLYEENYTSGTEIVKTKDNSIENPNNCKLLGTEDAFCSLPPVPPPLPPPPTPYTLFSPNFTPTLSEPNSMSLSPPIPESTLFFPDPSYSFSTSAFTVSPPMSSSTLSSVKKRNLKDQKEVRKSPKKPFVPKVKPGCLFPSLSDIESQSEAPESDEESCNTSYPESILTTASGESLGTHIQKTAIPLHVSLSPVADEAENYENSMSESTLEALGMIDDAIEEALEEKSPVKRVLSNDEDSHEFRTPKVSKQSHKELADISLAHTISLYRKQKPTGVEGTPVSVISVPDPRSPSPEPISPSVSISYRIRELQEEEAAQLNVISQASGAISFVMQQFDQQGTPQHVEAEKLLLLSTQKRQAALNEIQEQSKMKLTPIKRFHKSHSHMSSTISSPGGPYSVRSSNFQLVGFAHLTISNLTRNAWTLEKVPFNSPLTGHLLMKVSCGLEGGELEKSFLTMYEDVGGLGLWNRRWCVLENGFVKYWKYPNEEMFKDVLGNFDLRTCTTRKVELVSRDICARQHTFQLTFVKPVRSGDVSNLVQEVKDNALIIRILLSADSKDERITWCSKLNRTLANVRAWDPDALRPEDLKF